MISEDQHQAGQMFAARASGGVHPLQAAQATIRDLQTKLAHERMSREEAAKHADTGRQEADARLAAPREELEAERAALADMSSGIATERCVALRNWRIGAVTPAAKAVKPEPAVTEESEIVER